MDVSKEYILENVQNIISDKRKLNIEKLNEKYEEFKNKFEKLFNMCILIDDDNKLLSEINVILKIREDLKLKNKTDINANVEVSEHFAKQYVYPIIGEPTTKQKEIALNKIINGEKIKNKTK